VEELERLAAYEAIRQLASHYAVLMDSRDLDALVELFVEDVRVGRDVRGRAALRESFDGTLRGIGVSILNIGTHAITLVDDDHATGVVYCKGEIQDGNRWIHQAIVYTDTYERRDGQWLFVRRIHELFYGAEAPVNPMALPPADWPAHHDGRGTLPERWESWQQFHRESGD
jgi:ketosteroid isomerase-like protein